MSAVLLGTQETRFDKRNKAMRAHDTCQKQTLCATACVSVCALQESRSVDAGVRWWHWVACTTGNDQRTFDSSRATGNRSWDSGKCANSRLDADHLN